MISFEVFKACMMELYPGGLADELIALYYELLSGTYICCLCWSSE